ncbi:MAG TPA: hypothetical protein VFB21_02590 [Chthonomonadaceae bacterium]|nr:hypothetical protein [Chthonomonadaceae bacterium]
MRPGGKGVLHLAAVLGLLACGVRGQAQTAIPLTWVRDSSTYLGNWTGAHLLTDPASVPPDGVWGWGTQFGNTTRQYTDFCVAGGGIATITGLRLDSRPAPNFEDSDPYHFQLRLSLTDDAEESFRVVGSFEARRNAPAILADSALHFQDFTLPQPAQARYLRLYVLDNWGNNYVQARQLRILGFVSTPAPPAWLVFALPVPLLLRQLAIRRKT